MFSNLRLLTEFIGLQTTETQPLENEKALDWLITQLTPLGFNCQILGKHLSNQPLLVASFDGFLSDNKIVMYNHYDVAPIKRNQQWISNDPYQLFHYQGRVYARGIADNKGPLVARIEALKQLIASNRPIPKILWFIQGEEEISSGPPIAMALMQPLIEQFNATVYIEETGFNDIDDTQIQAFLWSPELTQAQLTPWQGLLSSSLDIRQTKFRHLNKLNGVRRCPLLANMPKQSVYIGFGPNDKLHRIHLGDESLDCERLLAYPAQFSNFLTHYAKH